MRSRRRWSAPASSRPVHHEPRSIAAVEGAWGEPGGSPKRSPRPSGRGESSQKKGARGGNLVSPTRRSGRLRGRAGGGDGALPRARGRRPVRVRDAELIVTDDEESAANRVAELLAEAARAGRD